MLNFETICSLLTAPIFLTFTLILSDSRYYTKKTFCIYTIFLIGIFLLTFSITHFYGTIGCYLLTPFASYFPVTIFSLFISKNRDLHCIFNVLLALSLSFGNTIIANMISILFPYFLLHLLLKLILFIITLTFLIYFRSYYLQIQKQQKKGWLFFCIIPFFFCITLLFLTLYPDILTRHKEDIPATLSIIFTMYLCLALLCYLFFQIQKQIEEEQKNYQLKLQMSLLTQQTNAILESEKRARIYRHDLRHYLQIIESYLKETNIDGAFHIIKQLNTFSEQSSVTLYCSNFTINVIISHYIHIAQKHEISIEHQLDIPPNLPIDELEIAIVIANAMENAVLACQQLSSSMSRKIRLLSKYTPHEFILEIANTFQFVPTFSKKTGLPISAKEDHGIGSQSISSFVEKYNGIIDYSLNKNWFELRIYLSL